ncbi:MAG TPA: hypothetical protein VG937_29740 [Polyangiaceae bacterium]|nr:hypothetical protein [Polyangiaceae bacterium]
MRRESNTAQRERGGLTTGEPLDLESLVNDPALDSALEIAGLRSEVDELRADLDPTDTCAALERASQLLDGLRTSNSDRVLAPGLELAATVLNQLRLELPPFGPGTPQCRGELRERHAEALLRVIPVSLELAADRALREAAQIGNASFIRARARKLRERGFDVQQQADGYTAVPEAQADELAVRSVRGQLGARLPPNQTDAAILEAVKVYRLPHASAGRPRRGQRVATDSDRGQALVALLNLMTKTGEPRDADDVARQLREARTELVAQGAKPDTQR